MTKPRPSAYALGATLYMPATHPSILEIVRGDKYPGLRSVVLCLEDALLLDHVTDGLANLRTIMVALQADPNPDGHPLVFVRPRSIGMAREIAQWNGACAFEGFVAPKARPGSLLKWFDAVAGTGLLLMPTLETKEFFDPVGIRDFRDEVIGLGRDRILAMRIGGNDLLACLGLRRIAGMTLYDGPLGAVVANLAGLLGSEGFSLTGPVFEILDDPYTLADELRRDVAHGLVGKTAIHPSQLGTINRAFQVSAAELDAAMQILNPVAAAVFKLNGAMCEPTTHRAWANNVVARAEAHGVVPSRQPGGAPKAEMSAEPAA